MWTKVRTSRQLSYPRNRTRICYGDIQWFFLIWLLVITKCLEIPSEIFKCQSYNKYLFMIKLLNCGTYKKAVFVRIVSAYYLVHNFFTLSFKSVPHICVLDIYISVKIRLYTWLMNTRQRQRTARGYEPWSPRLVVPFSINHSEINFWNSWRIGEIVRRERISSFEVLDAKVLPSCAIESELPLGRWK